MAEDFENLLKEAYEDFQKIWISCDLQNKVQILQRLKQQCENEDEEVKKNTFQIIEPFYVDLIRHANPKIFVLGLEMVNLQLNSQTQLKLKVNSLICALCMSILVKKDYRDKAIQLLLGFFEYYNKEFVSGIIDTFQFKEPKSIMELLRFFQLLIIKNDEKKIQFLTEQMDLIIDIASNFATNMVRQAALDLIVKLGQDLGYEFIKDKIPLLKESQRILIAKRLKEQGIADEEIQKVECQKQEQMKIYEKNKEVYLKLKDSVINCQKERQSELAKFIHLAKHEKDKIILDQNIKNIKEIPLFVDKIKYAKGKVKVHVIREIHDIFMNHPEQVDENQLVQRWNFEKYFTFENPLIKKQLADILMIYIKKMLEKEETKTQMIKILKSQIQGIIIQIIKTLCGNQYSTSQNLLNLVKYLLELGIFNHEIMTSFYDAMLNKSDSVQNSSINIFRQLIVSQYMLSLPKIDLILSQIAELTSSYSAHLRKNALDALVETAAIIGLAIHKYTSTLNKFQATKFQQQTKHIFNQEGMDIENENQEEQNEEQKQEVQLNQIQTNESVLNHLKLQLCMVKIQNEEDLISKLSFQIKKQQEVPIEQRVDFVFVFQQLLQNYSDIIIKNSTFLIGMVCESFNLQDNLKLFEILFALKNNEYTQTTLQKIFQRIGFQNISKLILDFFFQRYQEEKVCTFLINIADKIDDDTLQSIVKYLIQNISEVKDPQAKTVFINFLAKVQKAKDQKYVVSMAEQLIINEKARNTILKKIDQSYQKYDFLEKSKFQSDEIIAEKKKIKQLQQKDDFEKKQIAQDKNQKVALSFKEFRKQQLQKIKDENDDIQQLNPQQIQQLEQKKIVVKQNAEVDDEI
ncbi:hypothetical protein TTHERM_00825300 (macronuclear) [Tetrahymena thermophila SB210]|uniref:Armadillo-type fold n=1 Tax=Tetrahymena thermophila (strain SB210) TaxID=312017 RepID=I7MCE3_TETTS|nr:hypothetical protein TTHERM_00825300 [Tetrahymena thermophila SB210]EAR83735.2 hypothetical protein TTHERM_00825300 [Tetrahymena thermophila SB210]|eukprot:XP_001031398.2 hypothetical protein TTHERM_00825300 [Tetrahymena thermophila SB210]